MAGMAIAGLAFLALHYSIMSMVFEGLGEAGRRHVHGEVHRVLPMVLRLQC
jgi:hypothetical protein